MASKYLHLEEAFLPRDRRRDATDGPDGISLRKRGVDRTDPGLAVYRIRPSPLSMSMPVIRIGGPRRKRSIS